MYSYLKRAGYITFCGVDITVADFTDTALGVVLNQLKVKRQAKSKRCF